MTTRMCEGIFIVLSKKRGGLTVDDVRYDKLMIGLLSEDELAALIDVKPQTLQTWRVGKTGPDFVKLGKSVFYRKTDVEEWIAANVVATRRVMA